MSVYKLSFHTVKERQLLMHGYFMAQDLGLVEPVGGDHIADGAMTAQAQPELIAVNSSPRLSLSTLRLDDSVASIKNHPLKNAPIS